MISGSLAWTTPKLIGMLVAPPNVGAPRGAGTRFAWLWLSAVQPAERRPPAVAGASALIKGSADLSALPERARRGRQFQALTSLKKREPGNRPVFEQAVRTGPAPTDLRPGC